MAERFIYLCPQPPKKITFCTYRLIQVSVGFLLRPVLHSISSLFVYSPSSERRKTENTKISETLKIASRTSRQQCLRFRLGEGLRVKRTKNAAKNARKIEWLWVQVLEVRVETNSFSIPSLRVYFRLRPARSAKNTLALETQTMASEFSRLSAPWCHNSIAKQQKHNSLLWY